MTSDRVRNGVIIVVLTVWVVVVGAHLTQGKLPDAPLLGIPGAVWLALHPPRIGRGDEPAATPTTPPTPATPTEPGGPTT